MNTRGLQRALFRMQHDPSFAARLRAGDAEAAASTGLAAAELDALRALDPDAVAADRDGKRAAQLVRNASSEFALTLAAARARCAEPWAEGFARSPHFHRAVSDGAPLPLAFGAFAEGWARGRGDAALAALLGLERALAAARRRPATPAPRPPAGGLVLSADAEIAELPLGTFAFAAALRAALDAGARRLPAAPPGLGRPGARTEAVLIVLGPPPPPYGLRSVRPEPLAPPVAAFLARARDGLGPPALEAFAREHGIEAGEVRRVAAEYVAEGALVAAPDFAPLADD